MILFSIQIISYPLYLFSISLFHSTCGTAAFWCMEYPLRSHRRLSGSYDRPAFAKFESAKIFATRKLRHNISGRRVALALLALHFHSERRPRRALDHRASAPDTVSRVSVRSVLIGIKLPCRAITTSESTIEFCRRVRRALDSITALGLDSSRRWERGGSRGVSVSVTRDRRARAGTWNNDIARSPAVRQVSRQERKSRKREIGVSFIVVPSSLSHAFARRGTARSSTRPGRGLCFPERSSLPDLVAGDPAFYLRGRMCRPQLIMAA